MRKHKLAVLTAAGAVAVFASHSRASTGTPDTWIGSAGPNNWNAPASWSNGVPETSAGNLGIATFGTVGAYQPDIAPASAVASSPIQLNFQNTGWNITSSNGNGSLTFSTYISGGGVNGDPSTTSIIQSNGTGTNTISVPVTMATNNSLYAAAGNMLEFAAPLNISGSAYFKGTGTYKFDATGTTTTSNYAISFGNNVGPQGSPGTTTILLNADNVFGSPTDPKGINALDTTGLVSGTSGPLEVDITAIGAPRVLSNQIKLTNNGSGIIFNGAAGVTPQNLTINNTITTSGSYLGRPLVVAAGTVSTYGFVSDGGANLNVSGAGTLILTGGNNTASLIGPGYNVGGTAKLIVNGTASANYQFGQGSGTVAAGATLGGNGTIDFPAATNGGTHTINGTLAPGDPNTNSGVGTLTFGSSTDNTNAVHFTATGQLAVVLGGTTAGAFSSVNIWGNVTIDSGATVTATLLNGFSASVGQTLDILDELNGAAPTGAFGDTLSASNASGTYTFNVLADPNNPNDIALQVVTAPGGQTSPAIWALSTGGSWNSGGNWSTNAVPNAIGAQVSFLSTPTGLTAPGSITLDGNQTVGQINFNNSNSYSIDPGTTTPSSTLTIDDTTDTAGNNPLVNVVNGNHSITAPVVLANGLNVTLANGGGITFSNTITQATSGTGNIAVSGAGTMTLATGGVLPAAAGLSISNGAKVALGTSSGTQTVSNLTIDATSQLDLTNNAVVVNYGANTTVPGAIRAAVFSGNNGGHWNGPGINSSTAAIGNTSGVGYADGADGVVAGLSSGTAEAKYTFLGDANLDGQVTVLDLDILAKGFGISTGNANWDQGDFSYDGDVSVLDLDILATHFGDGTGISGAAAHALFNSDLAALESSNPAFAQALGGSAVPEPGTLSLLAIGAGGLLARRRRVR